jgi:hypothetical protein
MPIEVVKKITAAVSAGNNVTGFQDLRFIDFDSGELRVEASGNGGPLVKGLSAGLDVDVYPGTDLATGDLKFTRDLYPGEFITVTTSEDMEPRIEIATVWKTATSEMKLKVHLEKGGLVNLGAGSVTLKLYREDNVLVHDFGSDNSPDGFGMFEFSVTGLTLNKNQIYLLEVAMTRGIKSYTSNKTFTFH